MFCGGWLALLAVLSGCGGDDKFGTVSGTVLVDGQPVKGLEIIFEPQFAGGAPSIGFSDERGKYTAMFTADRAAVMVGQHIVRVSGVQYGEGTTNVLAKIPPRYGPESELVVDITPGSNTYDINIETK